MPSSPRLDPTHGWHHVMNRGVDRQIIFFDVIDRVEFGLILADACERFSVEVHAYCLMDNHFHLLVRCPEAGVSSFMQMLCSRFARFVNERTNRVGHLFGSRFVSRLLVTHEYIANVVRYIHRNPLDIDTVRSVEDYRWSSHRTYLGHRRQPEWMHTSPVLEWFGGRTGFARFVDPATGDPPRSATCARMIDAPHARDAIDAVIAAHSTMAAGTVRSQRRAIGLAIAPRLDRSSRDALLSSLGLSTDGALRTAEWRSRSFVTSHPDTAELTKRVIELLVPAVVPLRNAG